MNNLIKNPIFFIGAPRSGTTIISEIIFQHPDLAWPSHYQDKFPKQTNVNYIRRLTDNKCWRVAGNKEQLYDTSLLNKYSFKPSEAYQMWEYITGKEIDFSRGFLLDEKATENQKQFLRNYFTNLVKKQGRKRFAAKITGPPRIGYLLSIFPDAVFVLIRRKYVPTISSLLKVGFWKNLGKNRFWWTGPYNEMELEWAKQHENEASLLSAYQLKKINWAENLEIEKYHPNILEVHYEDFVTNPDNYISSILKHCDLFHDKYIDQFLEKNPVVSRNKSDDEYFDKVTFEKINQVLATQSTSSL